MKAVTKRKLKACQDAIEDLFCDTSVSIHDTYEAFQELQDSVDSKLEAMKADIKKAGED